MRAALDRFIGFLCRRILGIYFRDIQVVGRRRIPHDAPRVVVANHVNGLIDPLFVLGTLRLPARLLGKSTLWKIPVLAQILNAAGVIPVYRRQDAGADTSRNRESFERSHEVLARRGVIAIFPEGTSHDEPQLQPLRTGAARIVLEAEARFGPLGCRIVPVGLHFEERERFRSRALVVVGDPIDPAEEAALQESDPVTAARLLTDRIAAALEAVTLNYKSWDEARLVERGARLLELDELTLPRERRLGTEFESRRDVLEGLAWLRGRHGAKVDAAVAAARDYDRRLEASGLSDEQVISTYPPGRVASFLAQRALSGLLTLPFAAAGTAIYLVPYLLVQLIALKVRDEPNQIATYKVFPGIVLYPLWTLGTAWATGHYFSLAAGFAALVLAPACAFVAVGFHERLERLLRESRAFLYLRRDRARAGEIRALRRAVRERISELVELWAEEQAFDPESRRV